MNLGPMARRLFANLPRRAYLTLKYHGPRETAFRVATFPLRLTPWGANAGVTARMSEASASARRWYRRNARPVAVVIPSYGDAGLALTAAKSVKKTTRGAARVIVADDGSPPAEVERLRASRWVDTVVGGPNGGFAVNCNRGLRAVWPTEDAVLLNSDVVAHRGWLEVLQHVAYSIGGERVGVVGAKLLYPDGTIQFAGGVRNPGAPEWFDHRYRGRPADFGPSEVFTATLFATGACMYVTRETLDAVGLLDERYPMAFEDVDYCLRVWQSGRRVLFAPRAWLTHHESKTRGLVQGERELASQAAFWERWGTFFDARETRESDGGVRVVYVTEGVGVGGGHRVIFEQLNGLLDRGHHPELWTLGDGPPDWFDLRVPVRTFDEYEDLRLALAPVDAVKVATWWVTAEHVFEASVCRGVGAYHVQDIETSYYTDPGDQARVLASYRPGLAYVCGGEWIHSQLSALVPDVTVVSPGVDLDRWRELDGVVREDAILAVGRSNPLKRFDLTRAAYAAMPAPKPPLWLYGVEPDVAAGLDGADYRVRPSDTEVVELFNRCAVFLQTSEHEGFCLPPLEAMAAGAAVVCTDADANMEFCEDGVNCLIPALDAAAIRAALERLLADPALQERLREGGRRTAQAYAWPVKLDAMERFYRDLAGRRAAAPGAAAPSERP